MPNFRSCRSESRPEPRSVPSLSSKPALARSKRGAFGVGLLSVVVAVLAFWSGWPPSDGGPGAGVAVASGADARVAGSVCEAHELRALKEEDPHLEIEIPAEFDKQWPSASACQSAIDAWDAEAPGPIQPIPFSHKHHAGEFEIDCLYCHTGTDKSQAAGVPSVEVCMGCHSQFPPEYDEIEGIRILKQHWEEQKPIEWVQIHRLPEHVQFRHNRHIQAGVECQSCHGPVEEIDKLHLVPDTHIGYLVPVAKLEMGWCIDCHRQNNQQASQDCLKCHY
jgi:Cytochrome c7 and related cytochrome c